MPGNRKTVAGRSVAAVQSDNELDNSLDVKLLKFRAKVRVSFAKRPHACW